MADERLNILSMGMRKKHIELQKKELLTYEYFNQMAEEVIRILEEYYGSSKYWMAAEFERDRLTRRIHEFVDEIREGY